MKKKLVAALACRNQGTRLYGKPVQNLDIENGIRIIDNVISCLKSIDCIDEVVLGISEGIENELFIKIARENKIKYIIGDEEDVLSRLISCGEICNATDIFRVTSESPFLFFEPVEELWSNHIKNKLDATFYDHIVDGSGFEILSLKSLQISHINGDIRHRSEMCTLYIRENLDQFKVEKPNPLKELVRKDLRLTVDNPEDLVVCRILYNEFKHLAPRIPVLDLVKYLDSKKNLKELIYPLTESGYKTMYL
jgi:spore coat polysaccharide biosynthesis protein SpsF